MNNYLDLAIETALRAGRYLKERFRAPRHIKYKGEIDLVTDSYLGDARNS